MEQGVEIHSFYCNDSVGPINSYLKDMSEEMSRCFEVQYEITEVISTEQNNVQYKEKKIGIQPISCELPYQTEYPQGRWIGMEVGDRYSIVRSL